MDSPVEWPAGIEPGTTACTVSESRIEWGPPVGYPDSRHLSAADLENCGPGLPPADRAPRCRCYPTPLDAAIGDLVSQVRPDLEAEYRRTLIEPAADGSQITGMLAALGEDDASEAP